MPLEPEPGDAGTPVAARARAPSRIARILRAMHDEQLIETRVDGRVVHHGRYLTFRQDTVRDADGNDHTRDWVEHPGAVAMLPVHEGCILMVRQFRTPAGQVLLEIPAGTLDRASDGSIEDPEIASRRELAEETGYAAATWRKLGRFYPAPGFASELMHFYLATDLTPIEGYAGPMPDERISLVRLPFAEAIGMAERSEIADAKTLLGILWIERLLARGELRP